VIRINRLWQMIALGLLSFCLVVGPTAVQAIPTPPLSTEHPFVRDDSSATLAATDPASLLDAGRNLYAAGRFADAISTWQAAAEGYEARNNPLQQALCLSYLSLAYQALGHWEAAQTAIETSLALLDQNAESSNPILWAQALNTQANLWLQVGQPQTALETWEQAQEFYQQANDTLGALGSQINQAQALQQLGFYHRSSEHLAAINQQLATFPDSDLKISGLNSLGTALQNTGDFRGAYDVFSQSLAVANRIGAASQRSAILLNIGKLAADLDEPETALSYFETAEQQAVTPLQQLQARLGRFTLSLQHYQGQTARLLLPQIRQQLTELPPSRTSIYSAVNLANTLLRLDQNHQLLSIHDLSQLLSNAIQAARTLGDPRAEAYGLQQLGQLYLQAGQRPEAIDLTQQALAIARTHQAEDIVAQAAWQLGRLLKETAQQPEAITAYQEAVKALQALRGDLVAVNQDVQFSFQDSIEPVYRELVALLLSDDPDQAALSEARQLIESLQLAELDNFFRQACLDAQPEQIDQLDSQAAIVYPIVLPDRLAVILSRAGQPLRYYATNVAQAEVENTLRHLLALLHPSSDLRERRQVSQQVYDWLIRPIEQGDLADTQTLVFVLDGLLRNIPMAALYDGEHYLIEKYAVALSPGLQLMAARSLDQSNLSAVVGGISEARHSFSALPAVVSEVEEISQQIGASPLLNEAFTSAAVAEQLTNSSADIVHLATHGQFSSNQEDTFLLTWEGRINILQLSELLRNRESRQDRAVELLVLSACNTAAGDNYAVLGLAGLAVRSGARSTLATLWPVRDEAAALLMIEFYQTLQQPHTTKAEALRQAQLTLLANPNYEDPFFWSAYVLVGNWL
jgi:CHAT domain-containing protein